MNQTQKMFMVLFLCVMATCISSIDAHKVPGVQGCLEAILETEGCVEEVLTSFLRLEIGLGRNCCKALTDIDDDCFRDIFSSFPFNPSFPPLLKSFCTAGKASSPLKQ